MSLFRRRREPVVAVDLGTAFIRIAGERSDVFERATDLPGVAGDAMVRGVVNDVDAAAALLRLSLDEAGYSVGRNTPMVVSVPATATEVERAGVMWAVREAGIRCVPLLVEEPLAAAIGLGIDVASPQPRLVVDVGHGITESAVVAAGSIHSVAAVRIGCGALYDALLATNAREQARGASERDTRRARDHAAYPILSAIADTAIRALEGVDADTAASIDAVDLVGGGSLVEPVVDAVRRRTGLSARLAPQRIHAVAFGDVVCAAARPLPRRRPRAPRRHR